MTLPENKLDDFLSHRPTAEELVEKNILKSATVAPVLQGAWDSLNTKLPDRPPASELLEKNILQPEDLS